MKGLFKLFMAISVVLAFSVTIAGAGNGNGRVAPGQAKKQPAPVVTVPVVTVPPGATTGGPIGTPGSPKTIKAHVAVLEQKVAALEVTVANLQAKFSNLSAIVAVIQANNALDLGPFVSVQRGPVEGMTGPHIFFTGANIHILDGSGATDDFGAAPNGRGNLVIGYNEAPFSLDLFDRHGSHNLIVGPLHKYPAWGGIVGGSANTISGNSASVAGGSNNAASGDFSSVSGGAFRNATGVNNWAAGGLFEAN